MFQNQKISLVLPCHNEEDGLKQILQNKPKFIDEVVVIDNASDDGTAQVAMDYGARIVKENQKGYGFAYQAGLPQASGDIIVTMDGDGTYPLHQIEGMLSKLLDNNLDFVSGCRFPVKNKKSMKTPSIIGNTLSRWSIKRALSVDMRDMQTGMWVFRKSILNDIFSNNTGMGFSQELKLKAWVDPNIRADEFHIDYTTRIGQSKFRRFRDSLRCMVDSMRFVRSLKRDRPH